MPLNIAEHIAKIKNAVRRYRLASSRHISIFSIQLALIALTGGAVLLFMGAKLKQTTAVILQDRNAISQYQHRIDSLNQLRQIYNQIADKAPKTYELVTTEKELGDRIAKLDKLADSFAISANTKIAGIEPSVIHLTISATASIDTLKRYLLALESMPFLVNVQSLKFSGAQNQPGSVTVNANLYSYKP